MNNTQNKIKIAIVGSGASGLMAAYSSLMHNAEVTVFERNDISGKKLLLTGNGKCNFSNLTLAYENYNQPEIFNYFQNEYDSEWIKNIFKQLGVLSYHEKNGCLYPASQKAVTILQCLENAILGMGGNFQYNTCIEKISTHTDRLEIYNKENESLGIFDRIIVCCGGKAAPKTGSDGFGFRIARNLGHKVTRTYPVLVQLCSSSPICKTCAGVRCKVNATSFINNTPIRTQSGELQITEYGLSGILIFNLSRSLSKAIEEKNDCYIAVDFLPTLSFEEIESFVLNRFILIKNESLLHFLMGLTNSKIIQAVLKEKKLNPNQIVNIKDKDFLISIISELKNYKFITDGHKGYENAQASAGGISFSEVKPTMESKLVKGVYFAGEMLDIDGDCGGYNLHWAWTSGYISGKNAATKG